MAGALTLAGRAGGRALAAPRDSPLYRLVLHTLGGWLALHLALTALSLAHVAWSPVAVLALLAVVVLLARRLFPADARPPLRPPGFGWGDALAVAALALYTAWALSLWITLSDFVFHWGLKGHRFFLAGGIDYPYLATGWNWVLHPDYPNLLPEIYAVTALAAGRFDEHAMMLWSAISFALLLLAAREGQAGRGSRGSRRSAPWRLSPAPSPPTPWPAPRRAAPTGGWRWRWSPPCRPCWRRPIGAARRRSASSPPLPHRPRGGRGGAARGVPRRGLRAAPLARRPLPFRRRRAGRGRARPRPALDPQAVLALGLPAMPPRGALAGGDPPSPPVPGLQRGAVAALPRAPRILAALAASNPPEWHRFQYCLLALPLLALDRRLRSIAAVALLQLLFYLYIFFTVRVDSLVLIALQLAAPRPAPAAGGAARRRHRTATSRRFLCLDPLSGGAPPATRCTSR